MGGRFLTGLYVQAPWTSAIPVTESDFVVTGLNAPSGYSTARLRLVKLAGDGSVLWDRTYGGEKQQPQAMCATGDGGCVVVSDRVLYDASTSVPTYLYQLVMRKFSSVGDVVWERYLESPTGFMAVHRMLRLG